MRMYAEERDLARIIPMAGMPLRGEQPSTRRAEDPLLQLQRTVGNRGVQAGIRIHDDAQASASAEALDAEAYTRGRDIFFGAGRYRPELPSGRRLLLHEMAHVAQQQNPGPHASTHALEAEADRTAAHAAAGRAAPVRLSAPPGQPQRQASPSWTTGDVWVDKDAASQITAQGGLFSGNDQAHVNVSARGKLAYDASHTTPEDPFRWTRLKELVDGAHLKIHAVKSSTKFKATVKGKVVSQSLDDIRAIPGHEQAMGIALPVGESPGSAVPGFDEIYYDRDQGLGALTHELFGHEWLKLKGVPWEHPKAGTPDEAAKGTLTRAHGITDPFGNVYTGTVRKYIATHIESLGSNTKVNTSAGGQATVPKSPTQGVGQEAVQKAFADLHAEAKTGLTKRKYTPAMTDAWRRLTANYDQMPKNRDAMAAGNWNLTYTQEVILAFSVMFFNTLTADQKSGFRIMLTDFTGLKVGWNTSELTSKLEMAVGPEPSIYMTP